jgi:phosphoenolpyruvate carboxylase
MSELGEISCKAYRNVVYNNPHFISYFKHATPEAELGNLNIGEKSNSYSVTWGVTHYQLAGR